MGKFSPFTTPLRLLPPSVIETTVIEQAVDTIIAMRSNKLHKRWCYINNLGQDWRMLLISVRGCNTGVFDLQ